MSGSIRKGGSPWRWKEGRSGVEGEEVYGRRYERLRISRSGKEGKSRVKGIREGMKRPEHEKYEVWEARKGESV